MEKQIKRLEYEISLSKQRENDLKATVDYLNSTKQVFNFFSININNQK